MIRNCYIVGVVDNVGGGTAWPWFCGATCFMKKDELCEEPKEMKCEGEGIVSGCESKIKRGKKNGERKTEERG